MNLPVPFRRLLSSLVAYAVNWKFSFVPTENMAYEAGIDREKVASLDDANVISSQINPKYTFDVEPRHKILLDIDYPAYLIPSSTPGHSHLYLDVPNGVEHEDYMALLKLLGKMKVIEQGYAEVSIARGHSDLRLPWVKKSDQPMAEQWPTEYAATVAVHAAATKAWDQAKESLPSSLQVPFDDLPKVKQNEVKSAVLPTVWAALGALPDPRYYAWEEGLRASFVDVDAKNPYPAPEA